MASLRYGDILDLDVDVIVNASNTELQHGGSLAAAIVRAGGPQIQTESEAIGWCDLGSAVATGAGELAARHLIHVPTIDYTQKRRATLSEIESGTRAALRLARDLSASTIAFPLLGAGVVGHRGADVVTSMTAAMRGFDDLDISICVHWQGDWQSVEEAFQAAS